MQINLNLKKTLEQSANEYFEKAKKARRKTEGARKVIGQFKAQLAELEQKKQLEEQKVQQQKTKAPLDWYEKFRWFISSEGLLCIGGRDATTNEIIVKKHTEKDDLVFHTEMPGSPFFVVKTQDKKPGEATVQEVADATAIFSRAWKLGTPAAEVYSVTPDQVSRKAPSGEYLPKGAFMVTGKRTYHQGKMSAAVGKLENGKIMCGPEQAVKTHCKNYALILQGKDKPSDCAKKIARKLNADIDEVLRVLPAGTCEVK